MRPEEFLKPQGFNFSFSEPGRGFPGEEDRRDVLSVFLGAGELHREVNRESPCFLSG